MAIVAKGSENIWESFQVARDRHIVKDGGKFNVEIIRGELRKGVLRSEFRTKALGKDVFQVRFSYDFTIETDQRGDGEAVITQIWDGGSPSNSIRWDYNTNRLFYRLYKESSRQDFDLGPVSKGQNIRLVFILNGRTDNNGSTEIYFNGDKKVDYKGRTLFGNIDPEPYIKFGLYDDDDLPSGMPNRKVIFDNIILGNQNTTLQELGLGQSIPEPEPEPEEPEPQPEPDPNPELPDIKPQLVDLEEEISQLRDSLTRIILIIREIRNKL